MTGPIAFIQRLPDVIRVTVFKLSLLDTRSNGYVDARSERLAQLAENGTRFYLVATLKRRAEIGVVSGQLFFVLSQVNARNPVMTIATLRCPPFQSRAIYRPRVGVKRAVFPARRDTEEAPVLIVAIDAVSRDTADLKCVVALLSSIARQVSLQSNPGILAGLITQGRALVIERERIVAIIDINPMEPDIKLLLPRLILQSQAGRLLIARVGVFAVKVVFFDQPSD